MCYVLCDVCAVWMDVVCDVCVDVVCVVCAVWMDVMCVWMWCVWCVCGVDGCGYGVWLCGVHAGCMWRCGV